MTSSAFLAGTPRPPAEADWWRPWLDQIARRQPRASRSAGSGCWPSRRPTTSGGDCGPAPWHAAAGEDISYMPRSTAERIGLPLNA